MAVVERILGDIFDTRYRNNKTCIVHQCNCLTIKAGGLAHSIFNNFGNYANVYSWKREYKYNIAVAADRDIPGTIKFCHGSPNVIALFGQFFPGGLDYRNYLQKILANDNDYHLRTGFENDEQRHRLLYFKQGLAHLYEFLQSSKFIRTIVFPSRIGCGIADGHWPQYEKEIEKFAARLKNNNNNRAFNVIIVEKYLV